MHATFQDDPVAIHNIPFTGTDCLLWGNDYPHPESTYPNSNKVLDALLDDVADDDARAVVFDNAAASSGSPIPCTKRWPSGGNARSPSTRGRAGRRAGNAA